GGRCLRGRGFACVGERQPATAHLVRSVPAGTVMPWACRASSMACEREDADPSGPMSRACGWHQRTRGSETGRGEGAAPSYLRGLHPSRSLYTRPSATPIGGGPGGDRRCSHAQSRSAYRPYATNICNKLALDFMGTHCGHVTYPLRDSAGDG